MYSIGEAGFQEFLIGHIWRDFRCERVDVYPVGAMGLADRNLAGIGCRVYGGVFQMAASVLSARLFSLPAADEDLQFARQQLYEQELEAIRREARAFRHDYKNILAGLSAQAGAGELDALLTSLADLDAGFDRRVGEKIRMSTQIGNLRIPQVRGILLSKMAAMGEKGVDCRLEAIYPVERLGMCWLLRR